MTTLKDEKTAIKEQIARLMRIMPTLMKAAAVPQAILAEYLGVTQTTISLWWRGRNLPHHSLYTPLLHFTRKLVHGLKEQELPLKNTKRRGDAYKKKLREYFGITKPGIGVLQMLENVEFEEKRVPKAKMEIPAFEDEPQHEPPTLREPDDLAEGDEDEELGELFDSEAEDNQAPDGG